VRFPAVNTGCRTPTHLTSGPTRSSARIVAPGPAVLSGRPALQQALGSAPISENIVKRRAELCRTGTFRKPLRRSVEFGRVAAISVWQWGNDMKNIRGDLLGGFLTELLVFVLVIPVSFVAFAQNTSSPAGKWISRLTFDNDNVNYDRLQLELNGTKLTGKFGNNAFEGFFQNGRIEGTMKPNPQTTFQFIGKLDGDRIRGSALMVESKISFIWEASRESARSSSPQTHTFEPTQFQHFFADSIAPVLHINPWDTVTTWSVDAGGTDPKGVRRASGGNPLTGPFYIDGAVPGDCRYRKLRTT
jgi:hypothetical protein